MPPTQRGQAYRLAPNKWGLRYYNADGKRCRKSPFPTKSVALAHYRDVIEPDLLYLDRHGALAGALADVSAAPGVRRRDRPATR